MASKSLVDQKKQQLIKMTAAFCEEHLDAEYKQLSEKLIVKLARKRSVPFLHGRTEIWAAAIIHTLGSINFLFDKSFEPYLTPSDICEYFGTSKSTTGQKATLIRKMLNMGYYDSEFSTQRMQRNNPFSRMVMINGFMVPLPLDSNSHL